MGTLLTQHRRDRMSNTVTESLNLTVLFVIVQLISCHYKKKALVKSSTAFMSDSLKLDFCSKLGIWLFIKLPE